MSGIVGMLDLGGAPVDTAVIDRMVASLAFRGPDAQRRWAAGPAGLGHTLLATTDDAAGERQPLTLDGEVWMTADVRLDGRADLARELKAAGRSDVHDATDAVLLLAAYQTWGESCVDHLLGDWAFVIWDGPRRRLFCGRDQLGVKPLFYAHVGSTVIISNTLQCVRLHPGVSDTLNDLAIADFLLFTGNQELDTTAFADVRRVPGGHTLTVGLGKAPVVRPYWSLTQPADLSYRRSADYVEHFREVFDTAVRDRLRVRRVAVTMSGGLDSPAIAASAKRSLSAGRGPFELQAWTNVYEHLIPDVEGRYAKLAAEALQIPVTFRPADHYVPFAPTAQQGWAGPEPSDVKFLEQAREDCAALASRFRVVLTGFDADPLLRETPATYFSGLRREGHYAQLAKDLSAYAIRFKAVPPVGLRTAWRQLVAGGTVSEIRPLPQWINQALVERLDLRTRWERYQRHYETAVISRRRALDILPSPIWRDILEGFDPGQTLEALEFRHPFADLRVVNYLLSIPAVPWCVDKTLLREALRGDVPEVIRSRPKTLLSGDPLAAGLRRLDAEAGAAIDGFEAASELSRYVDRDKIPPVTGAHVDAPKYYMHLRPLSLHYWLKGGFRLVRRGAGPVISVSRRTNIEVVSGGEAHVSSKHEELNRRA